MISRWEMDRITEAGMFFEKQGPVWETLQELDARLGEAGIDYVVIGGIALNAHNYPRQTIDVDLVMTKEGFESFREQLGGTRYKKDSHLPRRFHDGQTSVIIDVLVAGEIAGDRRRNQSVRFPEPDSAELHGEIRTISLARLIELKLVTWRFKDWGDVVELIRRNNLTESFAEELNPVVRSAYGECYDQSKDPDYER